MSHDPQRPSLWITTTPATNFPALEHDLYAEVAIIGAGMTGITAAYLLKKAGKKVVLLERGRAALGETGHTTAHLTFVVDKRLRDLVRTFGEDGAKAVWDSLQVAIRQIEVIAREENINCLFQRVPGYLFGTREADLGLLEDEARWASQLGHPCALVSPANFPFRSNIVLRFEAQARFHPRRYLLGLLEKIPGDGSAVFEGTPIKAVESGRPTRVTCERGPTVTCNQVIVAAHVPFNKGALLHTKQTAYRSYAIAARTPHGLAPDALYWDTLDPYHYLRVQPSGDSDLVILGGEDHKTGQVVDTEAAFSRLFEYLRDQLGPEATIAERWSGQIIETADGLPFIGVNVGAAETELVATGYSGNGMTYGTLAGMMLADRVLGRRTPWDRLYDPQRATVQGTWRFVTENLDYALHIIRDRLSWADTKSSADVGPGEGKIVKVDGRKVAVSRDAQGVAHGVTPVCPHMGCQVHWNKSEQTWDCPCHGSRFLPTGAVVNGPAARGLEPVALKEAVLRA